jgi:hypothetical protein
MGHNSISGPVLQAIRSNQIYVDRSYFDRRKFPAWSCWLTGRCEQFHFFEEPEVTSLCYFASDRDGSLTRNGIAHLLPPSFETLIVRCLFSCALLELFANYFTYIKYGLDTAIAPKGEGTYAMKIDIQVPRSHLSLRSRKIQHGW